MYTYLCMCMLILISNIRGLYSCRVRFRTTTSEATCVFILFRRADWPRPPSPTPHTVPYTSRASPSNSPQTVENFKGRTGHTRYTGPRFPASERSPFSSRTNNGCAEGVLQCGVYTSHAWRWHEHRTTGKSPPPRSVRPPPPLRSPLSPHGNRPAPRMAPAPAAPPPLSPPPLPAPCSAAVAPSQTHTPPLGRIGHCRTWRACEWSDGAKSRSGVTPLCRLVARA